MPIETKTKYIYNGVEYDNPNAAQAAEQVDIDAKLSAYDPTSAIEGLIRRFNVIMTGTKKQKENNPGVEFGWQTKMPFILWFEDNDEIEYNFLINTISDVADAAFYMLKQRVEAGHWYFDEHEKLSNAIVERDAKEAALEFLQIRSGNEYECVEIVKFDKIGG